MSSSQTGYIQVTINGSTVIIADTRTFANNWLMGYFDTPIIYENGCIIKYKAASTTYSINTRAWIYADWGDKQWLKLKMAKYMKLWK